MNNHNLISPLGKKLENLCNLASEEIVLVAPFIKAPILQRILAEIKESIQIKCITRWIPEEILAGVSDLEVWTVINSFPNASLWLRDNLHAKYYRADTQCLIGSANLTSKALGCSQSNNLELLIQLSANESELQNFEQQVIKNCIQVNNQLFNQFQLLIDHLKEENLNSFSNFQFITEIPDLIISDDFWLPTLRNPEELYIAYRGEWDKLTNTACQAAKFDLEYFYTIPNLSKESFKKYIGLILLQKPLIQKIDNFVEKPQRFGAICNLIKKYIDIPDFDAKGACQTTIRWLLYFLPYRYKLARPNYSEILYRIDSN